MILTSDMAVRACRHALEDGTLLALHRNEGSVKEDGEIRCKYETAEGYRCAIGAALDSPTLDLIAEDNLQSATIRQLVKDLRVEVAQGALDFLSQLQAAHDRWLKDGPDATGEQDFRALLGNFVLGD